MTYILGLTGSIGMGKSTTAQMFRDLDVPVWDADESVHRLYGPAGEASAMIGKLSPGVIGADGSVDRDKLRARIAGDPALLDRVTALVHPLVAKDRKAFLERTDAPLVVLDIPLLFETGGEKLCDGVAVVSVPAEVQRARVLERGRTPEDFEMILGKQMPDAEKRRRADFVIETETLETARKQVSSLVAHLIGNRDA